MKKYKYKFVNDSILNPFFHTRLVHPIAKRIPKWVSPNVITILSFLFSSAGLFSTFYFGHTALGVVFTSLLYFLYVTSDCIDGDFARHVKKDSGLGEFLDHFHDVFGIGAIQISFCYFFQITSPVVIILLFFTTYIYTAERFHLVYHTGCMVFPKFGSWEPLLITLALFNVSLIPEVYTFIVKWINIIALASTGVNFLFSCKNYLRAIREQLSFLHYVLIFLSFLYLLPHCCPFHIILFIVLYNLHFIGSIVSKRLTDSAYPRPDVLSLILLFFGHYSLAISYLGAFVSWIFCTALLNIPRNKNS